MESIPRWGLFGLIGAAIGYVAKKQDGILAGGLIGAIAGYISGPEAAAAAGPIIPPTEYQEQVSTLITAMLQGETVSVPWVVNFDDLQVEGYELQTSVKSYYENFCKLVPKV